MGKRFNVVNSNKEGQLVALLKGARNFAKDQGVFRQKLIYAGARNLQVIATLTSLTVVFELKASFQWEDSLEHINRSLEDWGIKLVECT